MNSAEKLFISLDYFNISAFRFPPPTPQRLLSLLLFLLRLLHHWKPGPFFSFQRLYLCAQLTLSSEVAFGVHAVFIDGVDVVFRGLEGPELRAKVTVAVLAAVGTSRA